MRRARASGACGRRSHAALRSSAPAARRALRRPAWVPAAASRALRRRGCGGGLRRRSRSWSGLGSSGRGGAGASAGGAAAVPDLDELEDVLLRHFVPRDPCPGRSTRRRCARPMRARRPGRRSSSNPARRSSARRPAAVRAGSGAAEGAGAAAVSALEAAWASAAASAVAGSGGSAPQRGLTADDRELRPDLDGFTLLDEDLVTIPLAGLGTSVSTLSVEISSNDSSASICSPSL